MALKGLGGNGMWDKEGFLEMDRFKPLGRRTGDGGSRLSDVSKEVPCSGTGVDIPGRELDNEDITPSAGFNLGFQDKRPVC